MNNVSCIAINVNINRYHIYKKRDNPTIMLELNCNNILIKLSCLT